MKRNLGTILFFASIITVATKAPAQSIAAGSFHSMALCAADSAIRSWGGNSNGQLGLNDTLEYNGPMVVLGSGGTGFLTQVAAIVVRENFSLALKSDGTVWAWGFNGDGELGNNSTTDSWTPVQVHGPGNVGFLTGIVAIAGGYAHVIALKNDGTVWAWGDNTNGELGNNTVLNSITPVQVLAPGGTGFLTNIISIAAGQQFSLVIKNDNTVWSWGVNADGELGDNTTTERHIPFQVFGPGGTGHITGVSAVAAGGGHTFALKSDGTLWSWGFNSNGQLGINNTYDDSVPSQVHGPGNVGFLTGITHVAAGDYFSAAIKSDSTVWAWGYNGYGQLGNNTTNDDSVPVQVHGAGNTGFLRGITALSLGDEHVIATKADNTLWAWGWNGNGQLGDDSTTGSFTPVEVNSPCSIHLSVQPVTMDNDITVYPNPASRIIIVAANDSKILGLELYNILGEKTYKQLTGTNASLINIDISSQPAGVYFLRIETTSGLINRKFIIQR